MKLAIGSWLTVCLLMSGLAVGLAEEASARLVTHINDLSVHDPQILPDAASKTYYIYRHFSPRRWPETSTSGTNSAGVQAFWSKDLTNWFGPTNVFEVPENFWSDNDGPWAPEVHAYRGKYYLFTTFNAWKEKLDERPGRPFINKRASQVLVADSPLGPFRPFDNRPHTPPGEMTLGGGRAAVAGVLP
jgi:arabinan endo-1,5-alpha-L-arabinosidase